MCYRIPRKAGGLVLDEQPIPRRPVCNRLQGVAFQCRNIYGMSNYRRRARSGDTPVHSGPSLRTTRSVSCNPYSFRSGFLLTSPLRSPNSVVDSAGVYASFAAATTNIPRMRRRLRKLMLTHRLCPEPPPNPLRSIHNPIADCTDSV